MSWLTEALIAAQLIERVLRKRPGIRLSTVVGDYESLAPKLASGRLEFFVGPPPIGGPRPGITTQPLTRVPGGRRRARRRIRSRSRKKSPSTISSRRNGSCPSPARFRASPTTTASCGAASLRPSRLFEVQPLSPVIRQLLRESDLVTILPLVVVENEVAAGTLKVLPFDDEIAFPIHLTQRQVRYPSAARDYVIDELKELFRERARRKTPGDETARAAARRTSR